MRGKKYSYEITTKYRYSTNALLSQNINRKCNSSKVRSAQR